MPADTVTDPAKLPLCDLVMKGGITSGVVYPELAYQLSRHYRFKNIGGTSAGAIAAGACAAAEYGRQHGHATAFDQLKRLPTDLGEPVKPGNHSRLLSLFQPHPSLRPHFGVLLSALNQAARPAVVGMLMRMLANHLLAVAAVLIFSAALLSPLLAPPASGPVAFALALAALAVAGLAVHWATLYADSPPQLAFAAIWMATLVACGLVAFVGVSLGWRLVFVTLSVAGGALITWALLAGVVALRFLVTLVRGLHQNGYGLCSGRTMEDPANAGAALPGLTDWLTTYFDDLAGVSGQDHPLTFGDLWGGADRHAPDAVNLEVMTSAVSQQMIYGIPFRDGVPTLYYEPAELQRLFPARVTEWIGRLADEAEKAEGKGMRADGGEAAGATIRNAHGRVLRPFPRGADLPVVVAVRMSLSFPLLLSAIPLYAVDFTLKANQEEAARVRAAVAAGEAAQALLSATRIWFSDGGIGSNMPLHMFDALLPGHPTFAVNLKAEHPDNPITEPETGENEGGRIFLSKDNRSGAQRHWAPQKDDEALGGLLGFLCGIVNTMQNWRDEIQFPYPGFKDRIVQISLRATEGGLNLDMPEPVIGALGEAGGMAAQRLIDRFHPEGAEAGAGWANHRSVRLRTFLGSMQPGSAALQPTIATGDWADVAKKCTRYTVAEQKLAQAFLSELGQLGALGQMDGQKVSLEPGAPKPLAQIRITPKI
jgi:predicted acylesterase/phospholipase RssA